MHSGAEVYEKYLLFKYKHVGCPGTDMKAKCLRAEKCAKGNTCALERERNVSST